MGCFISFEGIDCCGKGTQIRLLNDVMNNTDLYSDPGSTKIGTTMRSILKHGKLPDGTDVNNEINSDAELLMFTLSRSVLYNNLVKKSLDSGRNVICDRYIDSTIAYQCYGRGFKLDDIMSLHNRFCGATMPDITFFIDISIDEWLKRKSLGRTSEAKDRFEDEAGIEFMKMVERGYKTTAYNSDRIVTIDGERPIEDIQMEIREILQSRAIMNGWTI